MSNDPKIEKLSEMGAIFKRAAEEIINVQNMKECCFSFDNTETNDHDKYSQFYENEEMTEFNNFDMLGEDSENDGNPFDYPTEGKKYEDITKDGGVLKILLDSGVGHVIPKDSVVFLHYTGYISNIREPFDVSYLQGKQPRCFHLGNSELLPGLDIGISTMTRGENARFIISPKYAYKEIECPPRIPPNSTVLFDVHLVSYFAQDSLPACYKEDIGNPDKFYKNLPLVKQFHFEGNEQFKLQNIEKAVAKYEEAKEILHLTGCNNDAEELDMIKYLNKLYSNLSICYLKLCAFKKVCRMGTEAMKYSERFSKNNPKLWFNWGKALRLLKDFTGGRKKLKKALNLEPQNITIQYELQRLEQDGQFYGYIHWLVTFKEYDRSDRLPSEFWEIFNTLLNEFVDSSDDVLTIILNNNSDDIMLAKYKSNLYNLKFQPLENEGDHYYVIKKK